MKILRKCRDVRGKISYVRLGSIAALFALEKNTGPSRKKHGQAGRINMAESQEVTKASETRRRLRT